jgi:hypothetical protein
MYQSACFEIKHLQPALVQTHGEEHLLFYSIPKIKQHKSMRPDHRQKQLPLFEKKKLVSWILELSLEKNVRLVGVNDGAGEM